MYERLKGTFTDEDINKLNKAKVLLVGVGGVGSFCFEVLIRSGILNITIIDFDTYEESNLNRQLHSNRGNIGKKKVDVLKEYALNINENINVTAIDAYLDDKTNIDLSKYDYIIDACDSIKAKCYLIKEAARLNIKQISALGIGNRQNPRDIEVTTLNKTYNDPLAKKLRSSLRKEGFNGKVKVVFSREIPIKKSNPVSSYIAASSSMGIILADTVIKDIINDEN